MKPQFKIAIEYFKKLILDEIYEKTGVECFIGGGAIRDYFSIGYLTTDVDIYFRNEDDFNKVYKYFNEDLEETQLLFENENAAKFKYKNKTFDIIKYFIKPNNVGKEFDFTVCAGMITRNNFYHHEDFFIDLAKKQIRLCKDKLDRPLSAIKRLQKYSHKGFRACNGELLKILRNCQRELNEIDKEEQENQQSESDQTNLEDDYDSASRFFAGID